MRKKNDTLLQEGPKSELCKDVRSNPVVMIFAAICYEQVYLVVIYHVSTIRAITKKWSFCRMNSSDIGVAWRDKRFKLIQVRGPASRFFYPAFSRHVSQQTQYATIMLPVLVPFPVLLIPLCKYTDEKIQFFKSFSPIFCHSGFWLSSFCFHGEGLSYVRLKF